MLDPEWSLQKSLWTFFLPGQSYSGMLISQLSLCLSLGGSLLPETSRDSGWAEAGSEDQGSRPFIQMCWPQHTARCLCVGTPVGSHPAASGSLPLVPIGEHLHFEETSCDGGSAPAGAAQQYPIWDIFSVPGEAEPGVSQKLYAIPCCQGGRRGVASH
jgi:hypothetical protein